jgi:predicted PurR-regulated permease PerM
MMLPAPNESICVEPDREPRQKTSMIVPLDGAEDNGQPKAASSSRISTRQRLRAEKFAHYSLLLLILATGIVFFKIVKVFLVPVILAAVFAGLFYPFYTWVLRIMRGRKALSAFLCCVALSLGLLLPAYAVANLVAIEAVRLYQTAESKAQTVFGGDLGGRLQDHPLVQRLHLEKLPLQSTFEQVARKATEMLAKAINLASRETFELLSTIFVTFFTMFYFFRDGPILLCKLKYYSPLADRYEEELMRRFLTVSRATIKGTLFVALIKGALGGLTFWAFGIEAPALWGVVMVFLSILPIVGAWVVMCPAALILVLGGQMGQGIALFLIAVLVIGSIDNVLEPVMIGRNSSMHDLLVFFSMLGGIGVFGVMGFIVGPVIAALFLTLLNIYGQEFSKQLDLVHSGRTLGEMQKSPGR